MKNPNEVFDSSMSKEEPLCSFLTEVSCLSASHPEFKERRRTITGELAKNGNIQAVRAWLNLAFPLEHAPCGKDIQSDDATLDLFVTFQLLLRRDSVKASRRFLNAELKKRGWPPRYQQAVKPSDSCRNNTDVPRMDNRVEAHTSLEREPLKPPTSHVSTRRSYGQLHFSKIKSENTTQGENSQTIPPCTPTLPPSAICKQTSTSKPMQNASDTRASSPLSECESDSAVIYPVAVVKLAQEVQTGASASLSKDVLSVMVESEAVTMKPKHTSVRGKKKQDRIDKKRRVSARLNASASKQSLTTQNLDVPAIDKSLPKSSAEIVQATIFTAINHQSVPIGKGCLDSQLLQNEIVSNCVVSLNKPKKWNAIIPEKKTAFIQDTSTSASLTVPSSRSKGDVEATVQSSQPISSPVVTQENFQLESKSKPCIKEQPDRRGRLRPRASDSSGNPTHVLPPKSAESLLMRHNPPLERMTSETLHPNKKRRLIEDTVSDVKKQSRLDFKAGKRSNRTKPSGKHSLTIEQTGAIHSSSKVAEKASTQKRSKLVIRDSRQDSSLPSGFKVAAPTVTARRKRKRGQHADCISDNLNETHDLQYPEGPSLKKRKRHSTKTISSDNWEPSNNLELSLPQRSLEYYAPFDTATQTNLSSTNCESDDRISGPISAPELDLVHSPNTDFVDPPLTSLSPRDDIMDNDSEITKGIKEEILDASLLAESKTFPIHNPYFLENGEEFDSLLSDNLVLPEELDMHFKYPDEHPDNYCRFPKPPLTILPPIWAESRQELCESFDWFRSYQGGVYHAHNMTKGYLLSGFPASRDRFEHGGRLIISHGGGKAESIHCQKGRLESHPATDQLAQDKSVRALFDNFVNNRPLALVMDDRYALFPYDLRAKNVTYAVLGFYTIADAWAEYQSSNNEAGRVIRYKFAFRWCDDQGPPWWEQQVEDKGTMTPPSDTDLVGQFGSKMTISECPRSSPDPLGSSDFQPEAMALDDPENNAAIVWPNASRDTRRVFPDRQCPTCLKKNSQVFAAWTCLNPQCFKFWRSDDGRLLPISMHYNPKFLDLGPSKPIPPGFGSLEPQSALHMRLFNMTSTMYAFTRGFHCIKCGRLSCRDKWETWECMNADCDFTMPISGSPREATSLLYQTPAITFKDYALNPISDIQQLLPASFKHDNGRGVVQTFLLPYENAKIHHIKSGNFLSREEADSIFIDYQEQATKGLIKFRRMPMRAHKCRGSLLTNYFSQNTGEPYKYVGGDKNTVPFDDNAPGAVVRARDLIQRRVMQALNLPVQFNEVLSAAYMERQRMAFHSDDEVGLGPFVAGLSLGSPALMHFRLLAKHDIYRERRGILLSIVLRHGDILVMDGAAVQGYYEHTVVPTNFRIAATARYIGADHV